MTKNNEKKQILESTFKTISVVMPVLATIFILVTTGIIFYFAKGYRINIYNKEIKKTGVLTIKSDPYWADITIDDKNIGKTPKSTSLDIGKYKVTLSKEGYRNWTKETEIIEEKSTILYPWLLQEDLKQNTVWQSNLVFENIWINEENNIAFILLKETNNTYSLWKYRTNILLWDLSSNPTKLLTTENKIDLLLSPDGSNTILTSTDSLGISTTYILNTSATFNLDSTNLFNLNEFSGYKISWANDNRYILLESDNDIISYDTVKKSTSLLKKKTLSKDYIWTTDSEGFFYIVNPIDQENTALNTYSIDQVKLDSTNSTKAIEKIYFQKDTSYIDYYRTENYTCTPCVNSPENTQTVGEIISIDVNQKAGGMYIKTTSATYWYDISTKKYLMVSSYPSDILEYSTESKKILCKADTEYLVDKNNSSIFVFTLGKNEEDHTEEIGSEYLTNIYNPTNMHWIYDIEYIYYTEGDAIYIAEQDGENKNRILAIDNVKGYIIGSSKEYLTTFEIDLENTFSIKRYSL